mmetsp:Transcript_23126/g.38049  ORF Transcript_23126/g.38049 Transcript_23126/m.38049 type:complete len:154 (+) Transcript_23126:63-524(+)
MLQISRLTVLRGLRAAEFRYVVGGEYPRLYASASASAEAPASTDEAIHITESCAKRIQALAQKAHKEPVLRVKVTGGGCSGFSYNFLLDDKTNADDKVFEEHGAKVIVDDVSLGLVGGSVLDFEQSLIRSAFKVATNPHAASSCGCGTSFNPK